MATSFAAFASQYLNRQQQEASSLSSSQPLFFSFTTDEGSRAGYNHSGDLDDADDPHLRGSEASRGTRQGDYDRHDEDPEDPYLRLDEEDQLHGGSRYRSEGTRLNSSHRR